ncbi:MAG: T9SS type A sorting domain-containing protein [bacterium]
MKKIVLLLLFLIGFTMSSFGQAALPFAYDLGKPSGVTGLTHTGLGSDYSSSPKMKFDTSGDNLILNFTGVPGTLSFAIKWNQSSSAARFPGDFEVLESSDGNTYTQVQMYNSTTGTALPNGTVKTETFTTLNAATRFIKWNYTSKSNGNIGIGAITLAAATVAEPTTQSSDINFSNLAPDGFTINWTSGDGANRVVFMKEGSGAITDPTDGVAYTASNDWNTKGTQLGASGYYCVYNGSAATVDVTNLLASTTYYVYIYEYNGTGTGSNYFIASPANSSQLTNSSGDPTISISTTSLGFGNVIINTTSGEMSYDVSGENLTDDITITPPANFEISKSSGAGFTTGAIVLTPNSGTVDPTTIFVRFNPTVVTAYSGDITHISTDAAQKDLALSGTGIYANTTDVYEFTPQIATSTIQSLINTIDVAVDVFKFTIEDMGVDGEATKVTNVRIQPSGSNTADWSNSIIGVTLKNGVDPITIGTPVITDTQINIPIVSGNLNIAEGGSADITLGVFLRTSLIVDNTVLGFSITAASHGFTADATGSSFVTALTLGDFLSNDHNIEVEATKLRFTTNKPPATVAVNADFNVEVDATDINNNRDLDAVNQIVLAKATGTGILSSATGLTQNLVAGVYSWTDVQYNTKEDFTINATTAGLTDAVSSTISAVTQLQPLEVMISHLSADYAGSSDEFVVLFNNTDSPLDLNGYELKYFAATGGAGATLYSFNSSVILPARKYLLLAYNATVTVGSISVTRDLVMASGMAPSGQLVLRQTSNTANIIFAAAWGTISVYTAGMTDAAPWPGDGMISLTPNGTTYTRTSYNSSNLQYTHTLSANIAELPNSSSEPLPVELVSFTANNINNTVVLDWQTATEINNHSFEVERKIDGNNWVTIGSVAGNGNSNVVCNYSFVDSKLSGNGNYQYRLKQIDNDGNFEYFNAVEVVVGNPDQYELGQNYPNPFNPETTIKFTMPNAGIVKLVVYNTLGQQVAVLLNGYLEAGFHSTQFNASQLSSGIYFYKLETDNFNSVKKMILAK